MADLFVSFLDWDRMSQPFVSSSIIEASVLEEWGISSVRGRDDIDTIESILRHNNVARLPRILYWRRMEE